MAGGMYNLFSFHFQRNVYKQWRSIFKLEMSTIATTSTTRYQNTPIATALLQTAMRIQRPEHLRIDVRNFQRTPAAREESKVVAVPTLAESVSEGDLRWDKQVGDSVAVDEVVAHIETDKTAVPVPTPVSGVIEQHLAPDGATVKPGQQLFRIKVMDVAKKKDAAVPPPPAPPPVSKPAPPPVTKPPPPPPPSAPPPVPPKPGPTPPPPTPRAPPKPPSPPSPQTPVVLPPSDPSKSIQGTRSEHRQPMTRMRQRIAERLKQSQNTNAMLTTFSEINMANLVAFRKKHMEEFKKKYNIKLGYMGAFVKASAYALQEQPVVNAVIQGKEVVYRDYVDVSIAVATPKGLVVPVVRNAERLNFAEIELEIFKMADKARKGALAIEDMDGGTFTVSNGGVFGSLLSMPIINPPQSAVLGMHAIVERPVAERGKVVIKPMMFAALTYDHRLVDGREAVMFLRKIGAVVEDPQIMFIGL